MYIFIFTLFLSATFDDYYSLNYHFIFKFLFLNFFNAQSMPI